MRKNALLLIAIIIVILLIILMIVIFVIYRSVDSANQQIQSNAPVLDELIDYAERGSEIIDVYLPAIQQVGTEYYNQICIPNMTDSSGDCYIDIDDPFNINISRCPAGCAGAIAIDQLCRLPNMVDNSICQLVSNNLLNGPCY